MPPRARIPRNTQPVPKHDIFKNLPALVLRIRAMNAHVPEFHARQKTFEKAFIMNHPVSFQSLVSRAMG